MTLVSCRSSAASASSLTRREAQHVAEPVAGFGGGGAQRDEQVGLAGAAVADEAERLSGGDPAGGAELSEGGRVEVGIGVGVEVGEPFGAGEARIGDAAGLAAGVAVVAFGQQQFGQERRIGLLLSLGDGWAKSCSGRLVRPVSFAQRIRSSARARRRWRSSRSGSWVPGLPARVLVANAVSRCPSAS
jgi:hypothetical protein